jgi:hypothetical protein
VRPLRQSSLFLVLALVAGLNLALPSTASATATAVPNAPTGLVASQEPEIPWWIRLDWVDNSPAVINGAPNEDAETFIEVERCTGVGCTNWTNIFLGWTPGYDLNWFRDSDANKTDGTTYSYRVRGRNDFGMSGWSNVATATTGHRAPAAPTGFTATYVGANSAGLYGNTRLNWQDNATTEVGYRINRCEPLSCSTTQVSYTVPANSTTYLDTSVVDGQEYWYAVGALGAGAFNGFGQQITHIAGQGYLPPLSPAATITTRGIKVTWRNQVRKPIKVWRCETNICLDGNQIRPEAPWVLKQSLAAGTTTWSDNFTKQSGTRYVYRIQVVTAGVVSRPVWADITAP